MGAVSQYMSSSNNTPCLKCAACGLVIKHDESFESMGDTAMHLDCIAEINHDLDAVEQDLSADDEIPSWLDLETNME